MTELVMLAVNTDMEGLTELCNVTVADVKIPDI